MKKILKKTIPLLVSLILIILIIHKLDFGQLVETFKSFKITNLLPICALYIMSLFVRGLRWKYLLLNESRCSTVKLSNITTIGTMMNSYLPARAGDIWRAYHLGCAANISKMKILGSIILERILDGASVFFLLLWGVLVYAKKPSVITPAIIIGLLFITALLISFLIVKFNKINSIFKFFIKIFPRFKALLEKIENHAVHFVEGFKMILNPKLVLGSFVLSMLIWACEVGSAYLIINSFGFPVPASSALFVISLTAFGSMIPSSSIFLGPYQYFYILALSMYNIAKSTALAISVVHQAILMAIVTILGLCFYLKYSYFDRPQKPKLRRVK